MNFQTKCFQKSEGIYLITIKNLCKSYKGTIALNNINLEIRDGEIFALLGTNGAGKTTLIKILSTLILPTSGTVRINNYDILRDPQKIKRLLNISPQENAVAENLTVKENLEFMAGVYNIENKDERIKTLIKEFSLDEVLNKKAKKLSGGWKRKLSIAISLINSPKILFLDEPTLGLDVIARQELWRIINKIKSNTTIILTTHYMEEAEKLSDRVGIINKGNLMCVGTTSYIIEKTNTKNFEDDFISIVTGGDTYGNS